MRSKLFSNNSSLSLGLSDWVLNVGKLVSRGMTASAPEDIKKGVSPVDLRGVVRYVHRTCGSSSTHLSFASSNLFLSPLTMILLITSLVRFLGDKLEWNIYL